MIVWNQPDWVGAWTMGQMGSSWVPGRGTAMGLLSSQGELIAGVVYEGWNGVSLQTHIAVTGRLTPLYLHLIHHYPFTQLGCRKLIAPVGEDNLASQRFVSKLGFTLEATLEDAHPGGRLLVYTMTKAQCRWLHPQGPRHGKALRTAVT